MDKLEKSIKDNIAVLSRWEAEAYHTMQLVASSGRRMSDEYRNLEIRRAECAGAIRELKSVGSEMGVSRQELDRYSEEEFDEAYRRAV